MHEGEVAEVTAQLGIAIREKLVADRKVETLTERLSSLLELNSNDTDSNVTYDETGEYLQGLFGGTSSPAPILEGARANKSLLAQMKMTHEAEGMWRRLVRDELKRNGEA